MGLDEHAKLHSVIMTYAANRSSCLDLWPGTFCLIVGKSVVESSYLHFSFYLFHFALNLFIYRILHMIMKQLGDYTFT